MHGSRELEVTRKTKFRRGKEEEFSKNVSKKMKRTDGQKETPRGFDMWGDDSNER